ncbi:hypothetical protein [Acetobacterium wieringae]|uniref:hypothetical protein n=1 Tax=Acetobacterium wieringae TaxID=52694 RepID=UPI0026F0377A|nr:hypothetical protein [Acetobacterium wieringae]
MSRTLFKVLYIITAVAIEEIFKFSVGLARLVNKVCTQSLIFGTQQEKRLIDDHIVKLIIQSELSS